METPVFISSSAMGDLVSTQDIVDAMESAFAQFSQHGSGEVVQPVRTVIHIQDHNGYVKLVRMYRFIANSVRAMNLYLSIFTICWLKSLNFKQLCSRSRYTFVMPAYSRSANSLGTKIVNNYPDNKGRGLPTHAAGIILLFEGSTGLLQAVSHYKYSRFPFMHGYIRGPSAVLVAGYRSVLFSGLFIQCGCGLLLFLMMLCEL